MVSGYLVGHGLGGFVGVAGFADDLAFLFGVVGARLCTGLGGFRGLTFVFGLASLGA